jgi:hypothetical protein
MMQLLTESTRWWTCAAASMDLQSREGTLLVGAGNPNALWPAARNTEMPQELVPASS